MTEDFPVRESALPLPIKCAACDQPVPVIHSRTMVVELHQGIKGRKREPTDREWRHVELFCNAECAAAYAERRTAERGYPTTFAA